MIIGGDSFVDVMPDETELLSLFESLDIYDNVFEQDSIVDYWKCNSGSLSKYVWSVIDSTLDLNASPSKLPTLPLERYRLISKEEVNESSSKRDTFLCVSREQLLDAKISRAKLLSLTNSPKPVWHFEVEPESPVHYSPGDAFGFFVENDSRLVSSLLERLKINDTWYVEDTKSVPPVTLEVRSALRKQFDLYSPPKKSFLLLLSEFCENDREKRALVLLSSDVGRDTYRSLFIRGRVSLLNILVTFPSCQPPLQRVLDCLPFLAPRYYSASSCYEPCGRKIDFVFSLVHYPIFEGKKWMRRGHATGVFDRICSQLEKWSTHDLRVTMFHRPSLYFHPPDNLQIPYLMICAGTGVAPFRGFIEQRRRDYKNWLSSEDSRVATQEEPVKRTLIAPVYLFFGCRILGEFQEYLDEMESDLSSLPDSKLFVCYSRENGNEKYVQDLLKKHAEQVSNLMFSHPSSCIYVCGDGANMAKGVQESLIDIMNEQIFGNREDAKNFMKELSDEKRYVQDIWFWG
ncbi:[methionine synthase] reductase [Galdieria sulphuraria]|uniref:[methionine synthase] reductase n=1 Tax=Galdieria sulphuraria TaxID=130081 RepID=M2Y299_GALSU|nr:[methionine synthase] reductase [Galdieria sulphuraria]EME29934.1 [methionine synthase] reductase [Galdieria sulphuraria]|eukprot:XP_005706454.1 [methionine synthase] reductase [Galdieria sulphuraria]